MKNIYLPILLIISVILPIQAKNNPDSWIHVFSTENGKTRVVSAHSDSIVGISYDGKGSDGSYSKMIYEYVKNGGEKSATIDMSLIDSVEIGANVPLLIINTTKYMTEIQSKENYEDMTLEVKGYGVYDDLAPYAGTIKGRGNSTWAQFPKKPYRLKFPKKVSLCGLTKAKSYVLLANYIDPTLLRNAIAFKVGEMLGVPYTNHSVPVNIIFNGIEKGAYQLSEKIGFNDASLPIKDEEGILFCLDQDNIDEQYNATSSVYGVKYMVKDPDFAEVETATGESAQNQWTKWRNNFNQFESAIKNGDLHKYLDVESLVDYLFVYNLTCNQELNHPKSVYIYKEHIDSVYKIGPLWDFDWAYTFGGNYEEGVKSASTYLINFERNGSNFFYGMMTNSYIANEVKTLYKQKWEDFKKRLPELWEFIDEYAHTVKVSAAENGVLWPSEVTNSQNRRIGSTDIYPTHIKNLKNWLEQRIAFIDRESSRNFGLYY